MDITPKEAIEILETEKECVLRQDTPKCIKHACSERDLCMPTAKVIEG